jgi:O-antigen ligase
MNRSQIEQYIARFVMVTLFLPMRLQVLVTAAAALYFVVRSLQQKHKPTGRNLLSAVVLGSLLLLYIAAIPLTPTPYRSIAGRLLEQRVSLLLLPVAFALMSPEYIRQILAQRIYFVYACLISCLLGNASFLYHHFTIHGGSFPLSHVYYRMIFEPFTGIHPTYMGLYLCFSITILLFYNGFTSRPWIRYALLYLLLLFLLSLLAKSPLIGLILIGLHYAWLNRSLLARYLWRIGATIAGIVATALSIPFFRQRMAEMLPGHNAGQITDNSISVRKLIWHMDTTLVRRHWLTGIGPGRLMHELQQQYFFYSLSHNYFTGYYDPHNQYFFEWISFGITGLLVLVGVLVYQYTRAIKMRNYLYLYLLLLLTITFFTESLLSRQGGVLFYSIFTSLLFFYKPVAGSIADED